MKPIDFLKALSVLIKEIKTFEEISGYQCCDFGKISFEETSPDEQQLNYELDYVMEKLICVKEILETLNAPIAYESRLFKNSSGRYEDERGYYYTCGSGIEYLYRVDDDDYEPPRWKFSRVEHNGTDYYIVGDKSINLDEVLTRVRK